MASAARRAAKRRAYAKTSWCRAAVIAVYATAKARAAITYVAVGLAEARPRVNSVIATLLYSDSEQRAAAY